MTAVIVYGYIPDKKFGEITYTSFIYHIFVESNVTAGTQTKFVVWNPFESNWEIKDAHLVKPLSLPTQDVPTTDKIKQYKKWLETNVGVQ